MENNNQIIKKNASAQGITLGIILALSTTLMYALNPDMFTKWWVGILSFLIVIVFGIISVSKSKGKLNGFISFKEAFTSYFITVALGYFISTLMGILIFSIIDPEMAQYIQEKAIETTRGFMEGFGAPEEEIDKALAKMSEQDNFSIVSQLKSYIFGLAFLSVLGLLVALIFKRKDPSLE
ncbi:DUF4199 domain-containing protein [Planktosalinus lacus]|uniref:DUF4199 domain-containing protein n=1 Tax=Planktosalinus lacus TaxID=1526573 RepID=A0A8J2Y8U8_9FLAO|nr:DUF4199 domain-containing protein [Planktosalinus lacus]GGD85512.1 hypothetical protein GCM10011312_06940 [Planktosalinus lacus]